MSKVRTHYDNLKVSRDAPPEVIRAAYRSLSQKYHPDRNPNVPEAEKVMSMINVAYDVLSDPQKRREHDEWIAQKERENAASQGEARPQSSYTPPPQYQQPYQQRQQAYQQTVYVQRNGCGGCLGSIIKWMLILFVLRVIFSLVAQY